MILVQKPKRISERISGVSLPRRFRSLGYFEETPYGDPKNLPIEIPKNLPMEIPKNLHSEYSENLLTKLPENLPTEILENLSKENLRTKLLEDLPTEITDNLSTQFLRIFPRIFWGISPADSGDSPPNILKNLENPENLPTECLQNLPIQSSENLPTKILEILSKEILELENLALEISEKLHHGNSGESLHEDYE